MVSVALTSPFTHLILSAEEIPFIIKSSSFSSYLRDFFSLTINCSISLPMNIHSILTSLFALAEGKLYEISPVGNINGILISLPPPKSLSN